MSKFSVIRVEQTKFEGAVALGQFPAYARLFSLRKDIDPHMHARKGVYYCGQCYHWVDIR